MIVHAARSIGFFALLTLLVSCGSQQTAVQQISGSSSLASAAPRTVFPETSFEFGEVLSGTVVEHDFALRNVSSAPTRIEKVSMTTPLLVTQMPRELVPGANDRIHFKLDTANLAGKFEGTILVNLNDPALPQAHLAFSGSVVPAIELSPRPAFFVAGQRGQGNQGSIEIVNHELASLAIQKIEHPAGRFTTRLETLERGQRYRLTLTLKPDGPGGRATDIVLIRTSSKLAPVLTVNANTYLYERVHAFPEVVDFGTWHSGDVGKAAATLMIHQEGGSDFKVHLSTDVPGVSLKLERAAKKDQYQVEVTLSPERIPVGPIKGSIFINTNDAQFPRVIVPVNGQIVER